MTWSYTDLQNKIAAELDRTELTSNIQDFIYLAEQEIFRRQQWSVETYKIANSGLPLPVTAHPFQLPDYVRHVKAMWAEAASYRHPITLVSEADLHERLSTSMSGTWNSPMPGIPTLAVIRPQMNQWMAPGATSIGPWVHFWPAPQATSVGSGATATATLSGSGIGSISVTNNGSNYDPNNVPGVMFLTAGPGSGAGATATVNSSGRITSVTVTAAGSGYVSAPTVAFASFAIDLKYVRDLTSVVDGGNALFNRHPDLYFYGALLQSAPFLQHDERLPVWSGMFERILTQLDQERERAEQSMLPQRARLARVF